MNHPHAHPHHPRHAHQPHDPRVGFFDQHAPRWEDDPAATARTRQRLTELLPRLGLRPGQHILEVGCGTGVASGWLMHHVQPGRLVAVDFSPAMLERARAKNLAGVDWRCHDICQGPLEPAAFDVAFCFHVFPHFRAPVAALRHLALALKPDGRLLVLHLAGSAQINAFHRNLAAPICRDHLPPPAAWPALLAPAGLRLLEVTDQADLFLLSATAGCNESCLSRSSGPN